MSASTSLSNLTIANGIDSAEGLGGGIHNASTLILDEVVVRDNVAVNGLGGGIYGNGLTFIQQSAIINNEAHHGAGIYQSPTAPSSLTIFVSTISSNTATGSGGGLFDGNGATINGVTIAYTDPHNLRGVGE